MRLLTIFVCSLLFFLTILALPTRSPDGSSSGGSTRSGSSSRSGSSEGIINIGPSQPPSLASSSGRGFDVGPNAQAQNLQEGDIIMVKLIPTSGDIPVESHASPVVVISVQTLYHFVAPISSTPVPEVRGFQMSELTQDPRFSTGWADVGSHRKVKDTYLNVGDDFTIVRRGAVSAADVVRLKDRWTNAGGPPHQTSRSSSISLETVASSYDIWPLPPGIETPSHSPVLARPPSPPGNSPIIRQIPSPSGGPPDPLW